jgi:hypothetical protein
MGVEILKTLVVSVNRRTVCSASPPNPKIFLAKHNRKTKRETRFALKFGRGDPYWLRLDAMTDVRCLKLIGNFLHDPAEEKIADNAVLIFRVWTRRDPPFLHLRHSLLALLRSPIFTMAQKWSILTALVLLVKSALATYTPASYYLLQDYQAGTANFFNNFNYFTGSDPSNGFVQFESFLVKLIIDTLVSQLQSAED